VEGFGGSGGQTALLRDGIALVMEREFTGLQLVQAGTLAEARAAGFDTARVTTPAAIDPRTGQRLADFLQDGRHGDEQTDGGHDQGFADGTGNLFDGGRS